MKKTISLLICLCLLVGLKPALVYAAEASHTHSWSSTWTASDTHHWHACQSADCPITSESECGGYAAHDFSTYPYRCTVCHYGSTHEHYGGTATCEYNATCEGCGTVYGEVNPNNHQFPDGFAEPIDGSSHKIMCSCGHIFVASESHTFTPWDKNSDGTEERWCEKCLYAETRGSQHTHSYSEATCTAPATCSCGATTGSKDANNHTGGTEVRGAVDTTTAADGYTGDIYCKGCDALIQSGSTIPQKVDVPVRMSADATAKRASFEVNPNITLPTGTTLYVDNFVANSVPAFEMLGLKYDFQVASNIAVSMYTAENSIYTDYDGTEFKTGEVLLIDNYRYFIESCNNFTSTMSVIKMSDGTAWEYDMKTRSFVGRGDVSYTVDSTPNRKVSFDGVEFDVSFSFTIPSGSTTSILSHRGELAGQISGDDARFYDGYDPESRKDDPSGYLSRITLGEKGFPMFGLSAGFTYDLSVVGASEIHLQTEDGRIYQKDSDTPLGFLSYTYELDYDVFDLSKTEFVSIHIGGWEEDMTFEQLTLEGFDEHLSISESVNVDPSIVDGDITRFASIMEINHFSPFIIYAFTEVEEPEIKSITSSTSNVGGADDSNVDTDVQPSADLTWLWIAVAVVVAGGAVTVVLLIKKRKHQA